ncbi:MAG TPA: hypothetical protein V6D00_11915 [Pantanalinema sp.]
MFKTMMSAAILGTLLASTAGCGQLPTMGNDTSVQSFSKKQPSSGISQTMKQEARSEVESGYVGGALNNNAVAVNIGKQSAKGSNINQRLDQEAKAKVENGAPSYGYGYPIANGNAVSVNYGKQRANSNKRY